MLSITLIAVIVAALVFDFINGFHDTANCIATSISTRALSPRSAILMAAILNFVGALMSESVAKTISEGLVDGALAQYVLISALLAAIIWNLVTWYFGIPSSSSHALIGSLVGASIVYASSLDKIVWGTVLDRVILPLVSSPVLGFLIGFLIMKGLNRAFKPFSQRVVNSWFSKLQIFSAAFMSYTHGGNDAQKSMGIITLALVSSGMLEKGDGIPLWVKISCAIAMALGTSVGGWRIIKTIGLNMIKLQPVGGFAAQTGAAMVIETMTQMGSPVSTTHVITSSIMGVGASKRLSAVKWVLAKNIVVTWIFTLPVTMILGAAITLLVKTILY